MTNPNSLALYELANESNVIQKIEENSNGLLKLISKNKDFKDLIKDPTVSQEDLNKVINKISENLPGVHHYSWFDLERKVYTYKNYWSKHWSSLYKRKVDDTKENNMFFEKSHYINFTYSSNMTFEEDVFF